MMYTQAGGLIVAQYLSNIIGMVPKVIGRRIIWENPFLLLVGLQTWQVRHPFFSMLSLAFLNIFLCGLRAKLPTQVFRFVTIRIQPDRLLGLWHFLGGLLGRFLRATGPGISYFRTTAGIMFCLFVWRFYLLTIGITVTPRQFAVGVISMATTYWSI